VRGSMLRSFRKSIVVVLVANALREKSYKACEFDAHSANVRVREALGIDKSPSTCLSHAVTR
jgi:hypothetical protein